MTKAQQRKTSSLGADTITILKLQYELAFGLAEADENFQRDIGKYFPPEIIANPEAVKQVNVGQVGPKQSNSFEPLPVRRVGLNRYCTISTPPPQRIY